ncbi:hypothetical protein [Streptomyces uncialis]|uniref:hypothetical protein n=1 Tax=Streptomyces uncialis TaxID=1048205 RepID=UPI00386FEDCE|nr:hypothetical protein OG268_19710 [Streptomyces uncialis]
MDDQLDLGSRVLAAAFAEDLRNDWIPDALGADEVRRAVASGALAAAVATGRTGLADAPPPAVLRVPLAGRSEDVPLLPPAQRAALLILTEHALRRHRPLPGVFSYRSAGWRFSAGYRARQSCLLELSARQDLPYVLDLDVAAFARTLPLSTLLAAPWMTNGLGTALQDLHRATGRCLPHGQRWNGRVATAVLAPVDTVVERLAPKRWARWGDGWHIFVSGPAEAVSVREAVVVALSGLGLRLAAGKSALRGSAEVTCGSARDVAGPPLAVWRRAVAVDDPRGYRYALARAAPSDGICAWLPEAVRSRPTLLPRAVMYLDRAMGTPTGNAAAERLLGAVSGDDPFTVARLLVLAGRHRGLAARVPDRLLITAAGSGVAALEELSARAAGLSGRTALLPEPSPRLRGWLAAGGRHTDRPPWVDTLL